MAEAGLLGNRGGVCYVGSWQQREARGPSGVSVLQVALAMIAAGAMAVQLLSIKTLFSGYIFVM